MRCLDCDKVISDPEVFCKECKEKQRKNKKLHKLLKESVRVR